MQPSLNLEPRRTRLALLPLIAALAACQPAPAEPTSIIAVVAPASALGARLSSTLPSTVPLQTALALNYGAATPSYASLYTVASSGQVMRMFENRPVRPGVMADFPNRAEPVLRFGPPAGAEHFVLVVTTLPLRWLAPTDYADATPYARLNLDRGGFEARLAAALTTLPSGSSQVQRLTIVTQ